MTQTGIRRVDRTYRGKPTHHYTLDGIRADGVTTLLGNGLPKPALLPWGIKSVAEYAADHLDLLMQMQPMGREAIVQALKQAPYTDRDTAAKRGTEVHALAEKLIKGEDVEVPAELAGHVESYLKFLDEWQPKPVLVEAVVASRKWGYCGTADLLADLPDGSRAWMDIKTTRSGIFGETALQLAAYQHAEFYLDADGKEQEMSTVGPVADVGYGIWVRADGYSVIPLPTTEQVFKTFCHIAYVARQTKVIKEWAGEPVDPPQAMLTLDGAA